MAGRPAENREVQLTFIGGGSRNWAPGIMADLALCPQLSGELVLYDIDYAAARQNVELARGIFDHPDARTSFAVRAEEKLEDALKGADLVMIAIQPGPITMMADDIDIPKKYGILHTVGDTAGPAGLVRALRCIPIYLDYAEAVMSNCPDAWVMNCTNPMAVCVGALYAVAPEIKAFGYCHEVFHTQRHLADLVEEHFDVESCDRREIRIHSCGVNHFTVATSATWRGEPLFPLLYERMSEGGFFADRTALATVRVEKERWFETDHLVAYDLLRRFGVFGAAGDRHLVEFVPWYLGSREALHRWGVVCTPSRFRLEKHDHQREGKPTPPEHLEPSGGENLEQFLALLGLGDLDTSTNIPNRGQIPGLTDGAVLESNVRFRRDALEPLAADPLPAMANALQQRIVHIHNATLEAGILRDKDTAVQALLMDPLVRLSTDRAVELLDEMMEATRELLPGWDL